MSNKTEKVIFQYNLCKAMSDLELAGLMEAMEKKGDMEATDVALHVLVERQVQKAKEGEKVMSTQRIRLLN